MSKLTLTSPTNSPSDFEQELELANRRGLEAEVGQVRVVEARYDRASDNLVLILRGGMTLLVPAHLLQGVAGQAPELIEQVELEGNGSALHFEALDADFSVQDVAAGSFGSHSWMQQLEEKEMLDPASIQRRRKVEQLLSGAASSLGSKGGRSRTKAKTDAARANGAKGGRPRTTLVAEIQGETAGAVTGNIAGDDVRITPILVEGADVEKEFSAIKKNSPEPERIKVKIGR